MPKCIIYLANSIYTTLFIAARVLTFSVDTSLGQGTFKVALTTSYKKKIFMGKSNKKIKEKKTWKNCNKMSKKRRWFPIIFLTDLSENTKNKKKLPNN